MKSPSAAHRRHRLRQFTLCSTALSVSLLAGSVAMAAAPAAGSLPGAFSTNQTGTTYTGTGSTATIAIGGATAPTGPSVIQFGGTALATPVSPKVGTTTTALASATNAGFSSGAGSSLTLTNSAAAEPTLINDQSGSASQIYGSVDASGLGGPLFIANANGVVVGAGGSISTPDAGVGLIGFAQDSGTFDGTGAGAISVSSSSVAPTLGTGAVSIAAGGITGTGAVLVAGNGAINVGVAPAGGLDIVSGYGFSTSATSVAPTATTAFSGTSSSVTLTGGSSAAPTEIASLSAAGNVTNSGVTDFTDAAAVPGPAGTGAGAPTINGAFSNTGVAYVGNDFQAGSITNAGQLNDAGGTLNATGLTGATSGADITNTGVINESTTSLTLSAGKTGTAGAATGNFTNSGVIAFTQGAASGIDSLTVDAANIDFAGSVTRTFTGATAPTALSSTNALSVLTLNAFYAPATGADVQGVVDYGSTIYSHFSVTGQAVRILSGGLYDPTGALDTINVGTGTATDPFAKNAKLGYNLSVFPKAMIQAGSVVINGSESGTTSSGSNLNLDGVVSTQMTGGGAIQVTANNINGNAGGGFALNDGQDLTLAFSGNINNPNGASAAGSSDFRYNYVPVAVANASAGGAGTVNLHLFGPTNSTTTAQNVNILVNGNVAVNGTAATATLPTATTPITPAASYVNNHLVLQATGNVMTTGAFYWPGLLYLNTVASMSNPTQLSTSGSISLGGALSNILPAFSTGGTGIFLETNNLNLNGNTVTTSNNSWVNFASAKIASAFSLTQASNFFWGYKDAVTPTVTELGVQQLPAADFQP